MAKRPHSILVRRPKVVDYATAVLFRPEITESETPPTPLEIGVSETKEDESIMKELLTPVAIATLCATTAFAQTGIDSNNHEIDQSQRINVDHARASFLQANPQSDFNIRHEHITRIYGKAFSHGNTPLESATNFIHEHANMFGIEANELLPIGPNADGTHVLGLGYDKLTGTNRFSLVGYSQTLDNIPVFRGDIRILVRNEPGFPTVLVSNAVIDMSDYDGRFAGLALRPSELDKRVFLRHVANQFFLEPTVGGLEQVIWAGYDGDWAEPTLAVTFVATGGTNFQPDTYQKYRYVVDARNGKILFQENMLLDYNTDIQVTGRATQADGSDSCHPEVFEPMPYARVVVGGTTYFADVNGNIAVLNSQQITAVSDVYGQYFVVNDEYDSDVSTLSATIPAGSSYTFEHNSANGSEYDRAEINAYNWANRTRDWALSHFPLMPTVYTETFFPININIGSSCNAFYDYESINFYAAGGSCPNTAFSDVVAHEYGHHMIAVCGSGQGQYGEGGSDCNGIILTREPTLGNGFLGNCGDGIRTADNDYQYPCSGGIHDCGQLLSGCIWDLILVLGGPSSDAAFETVGGLWVNSICLHTGTEITPDITIDFLVIDDNDDNIYNGTPNYGAINSAFSEHNMPGPELSLLEISTPNGVPSSIPPAGADFDVVIADLSGTYQSGTAKLNYALGSTGTYQSVNLTSQGGDLFTASLPAADCGDSFSFYISAETTDGFEETLPIAAPGVVFGGPVATGFETVLEVDFETDPGWVASGVSGAALGEWERGTPCGTTTRGAPGTDFDGSGQCFVTGNGVCDENVDVDDGCAILTTAPFSAVGSDGSQEGDANVTYALWYDNTGGGIGADPSNDIMEVDISTDGGSTWANVETIGPLDSRSSGGWFVVTFQVSTFASPTDQCIMRFTTCDANAGSVIEAAVDMFSVELINCDTDTDCDAAESEGDANGDGVVNGQDLGTLLGHWLQDYPAADFDCSGVIDGVDLGILLGNWTL